MMKTADLVAGPQTDALVALAQDWEVERYRQGWRVIRGKCIAYHIGVVGWGNPANYSPSSTPAQWAELIEEFGLSPLPHVVENGIITSWSCARWWPCNAIKPLIGPEIGLAICKAVIAAKWGDEIPAEILDML